MASRMFSIPVTYSTSRSRPSPNPAWGTVPYRRRSLYHSSPWSRPCSAMRRSSTSRRSSRWLPPHRYGTPQGLAVDSQGTLYYADLDLQREGLLGLDTGPDGKVWRIRFDADGTPQTPQRILDGLSFPDGLGVLRGDLEER